MPNISEAEYEMWIAKANQAERLAMLGMVSEWYEAGDYYTLAGDKKNARRCYAEYHRLAG